MPFIPLLIAILKQVAISTLPYVIHEKVKEHFENKKKKAEEEGKKPVDSKEEKDSKPKA